MLILKPYLTPFNPGRKALEEKLHKNGLLLGAEDAPHQGRRFTLKRWAREEPEFVRVEHAGEFGIIRVFVQYLEDNPTTDFIEKTRTTHEAWRILVLSRIVTFWVPLGPKNPYRFILTVGDIKEEDVKTFFVAVAGVEVSPDLVTSKEFDFTDIRRRFPEGWVHGCENRPDVINKGTFYGDFHFDQVSEINDFLDSDAGTVSNRVGIVLQSRVRRKVHVLRNGRFQLLGITRERFIEDIPERLETMKESFDTARLLLESTH